MKRSSFLRAGIAAVVTVALLASCGSSDSRDRNVASLKLCSQGGPCNVGDVGPAGGIVVVGAEQPGVDMWEVAPINGFGTYLDAITLVDDLTFGGLGGWVLPSGDVVTAIENELSRFTCAADTDCATEFGSGTYWTADREGELPVVVSLETNAREAVAEDTSHFIRPVRSFQVVPADEVTTTTEESVTTTEVTVAPVDEPTTTEAPPTVAETTTVEPVDCTTTDSCQVGDRGPGGGIVFYVSDTPFTAQGAACKSSCTYLEASPASAVMLAKGGCGSTDLSAINDSSPGAGFANSIAVVAECGDATTAASAATTYVGGGLDDWYLPSLDEMSKLVAERARVVVRDGFYWTSTNRETALGVGGKPALQAWAVSADGTQLGYGIESTLGVRPIRAFGSGVRTQAVPTTSDVPTTVVVATVPAVASTTSTTTTTTTSTSTTSTTVAPTTTVATTTTSTIKATTTTTSTTTTSTTTTSTTTTSTTPTTVVAASTTVAKPTTTTKATTTTIAKSCREGGKCKDGDEGPEGGRVYTSQSDGAQFEVAPITWYAPYGTGVSLSSKLKLGGKDDWRLPTPDELLSIRANRANFRCATSTKCPVGFANSRYWAKGNGPYLVDFGSNTSAAQKVSAETSNWIRPVRSIDANDGEGKSGDTNDAGEDGKS